jgi:hypothetical protein
MARAQAYPTRPITMVAPYAAGGAQPTIHGTVIGFRARAGIYRRHVIAITERLIGECETPLR